MKLTRKTVLVLLAAVLMSVVVALSVFATDAASTSGYLYGEGGKEYTNIKWTMTEENGEKVVTFEIDATATDKKATTVVYSFDPVTGKGGGYGSPIQNGWGAASGVTKVIFKEGITEINGGLFCLNKKIKTVEFPKSLVTISGSAIFEGCHELTCIYIAGNTPEVGVLDLSGITSFKAASYAFDNVRNAAIKAIKFSPDLTGTFDTEFIKNIGITELEIPAGVTKLGNKSLTMTNKLKTLTILGMETVIESDAVFASNTAYPAIKAKAGSKAAEFALANGYTFIDLDTGVETKGTKPAPSDAPTGGSTGGSTGGTSGGSTGGTSGGSSSYPIGLDAFNPDEATGYGYIGGQYYDTYWVYYQETKTLKFFTNKTSGWNETGRIDKCEDKKGWSSWKNEIEYVEIGPQLAKVTGSAFAGHTALKEVKLGRNITQIDPGAFSGCTALTTVWYDGGERVEGRMDLTKVNKVNKIIDNTAIKEVLLSPNTTSIAGTLSFGLKTILAPNITDELITFAKENSYNLQSTTDPNLKYEYWIEIPEGTVSCGARAAYYFDEATGTMTIYGSGALDDIVNYHGGGSKNSPWFEIKQQIKHVILQLSVNIISHSVRISRLFRSPTVRALLLRMRHLRAVLLLSLSTVQAQSLLRVHSTFAMCMS